MVVVPGSGQLRPRLVARSFDTREDAEGWLKQPDSDAFAELEQDVVDGRDPLLREYATEWMNTRRVRGKTPLKPRTRDHYQRLLDALILPDLGGMKLSAITPRRVDRWHASLDHETATMTAHAYSLLRAIMATAVRQDVIAANPCRIDGAGNAARVHEPVVLSVAEVLDLRDRMPARYRAMVTVAAFCGLRFGELTELRRSDIDREQRLINVTRGVVRVGSQYVVGTPKSRAGRRVVEVPEPVMVDLEHHLERHVGPDPDALIFPGRSGQHMAPSTLYKPFYAARAAIGRPTLRWHDLRHTAATLAAGIPGVSVVDVMARLGQTTPGVTLKYLSPVDDRRALITAELADVITIESRRRTASGT
jgi:integrase